MTDEARAHKAHADQRLGQAGLAGRIRGAAFNVAAQWNVEPEDVEQEIILAILEEYASDPAFLDQADAFIVNRGAWAARDHLRRMAAQEWNHEVEDAIPDLVGEANPDPWATVDLEAALASAYDELNATDQGILFGVYQGMTRREIGKAVGLSHTSVNNHVPAIAEAIRAHL